MRTPSKLILGLAFSLFGLSAQAACDLDLDGKWKVVQTSIGADGPRKVEDMPHEYGFKDGNIHVLMGFIDVTKTYSCNGKSFTINKLEPATMDVVSSAPGKMTWVEQGGKLYLYLERI
ncbi:hypothetical protein ABS648_22470 [Pseudomonas solani]|uniref:Lipocalin-like domain-containing protein n=1 Tax=Pseudomonas solani TaxID=2731552 RepID=A0AAU7XYD4_9PSED|nr:hypothetical protein L682_25245 [Pseudomonas alcaligenes OT 69]MDN4144688.1 hypothetical protein [Pseudomonas tohonis]